MLFGKTGTRPWFKKKGEADTVGLKVALYANKASGRRCSQSSCSLTRDLSRDFKAFTFDSATPFASG